MEGECNSNTVVEVQGDGDDVNWLECISAIETDQGLLYFCDASYGLSSDELSVLSNFTINIPEGSHIYSITGYNPLNKVTNRLSNELANRQLLNDLNKLLPGCKIHRNFSYFPRRPYHFERGYTIVIPSDYEIRNHGMIIYSLSIKYEQAAFFRGVVMKNGVTIPYVVLVQGEYTELKEKLVCIKQSNSHPAFLHAANNVIFKDLTEVLSMLYQFKDQVKVCDEMYQIFQQNFRPLDHVEDSSSSRHPVISIEGSLSKEMAIVVSRMLDADYYQNTPTCLREMKSRVQNCTVLLAAFKTLADYIQASLISNRSSERSVVVRKYWSNTAASVIASEIHKGQSNLPPKHHSVYQWPEGLFKPDAVIFLHKKSGLRTDKQKLKDTAMKRMSDDSWIHVGIRSSKKDAVPSLVIDKLHCQGITGVRAVDAMCPASDMPSQHSTPSEARQRCDYNKFEDSFLVTSTADDSQAKPFWW